MYYILFYDYIDNVLERRAPHRSEHLALAQAAHERGELLLGGALAEPVDGAMIVFKANGPETVENFVRNDPYVKNGLVTRWQIRQWTVVIGGS
jgi:hypothetical protein